VSDRRDEVGCQCFEGLINTLVSRAGGWMEGWIYSGWDTSDFFWAGSTPLRVNDLDGGEFCFCF